MKILDAVLSLVLVSARRRGVLTALAMAVAAGGVALWIVWPVARVFETAVVGDNMGWYLEMAANMSWCHRYPFVTSTVKANQTKVMLMHLSLETVGARSLRSVAVEGAGSIAEYCKLNGTRMALPEASMVMVESALLSLRDRITVSGIAWALTWIAVAEIAVFTWALLKLRWPMLFAGSCAAAALYITALLGTSAMFSQYRLMLPTMLLGIGIGALCVGTNLHRRLFGLLVVAFVMGVWVAFAGNLRTSLYPPAAAIGVLFLAAVAYDLARSALPRRRVVAMMGGTLAAVLTGVMAFDLAYIAPQRAGEGYSYHVAFHPIVIGLAVPPNALAAREHLEWLDDAGAVAARKVDARVEYLGAGYDRALSTYYFRLWRQFPFEMAGIYREKFALARQSAEKLLAREQQATYWFVKDGKWMTRAAWPALKIADVVGVISVFTVLFLIGVLRPRALDLDLPRGFLLAALALAVLGNFVESAVTLADVVMQYSNIYLIGLIFAGLLTYQTVIDVCWRRWGVGAGRVRV
jgi:hypothetical protein